MDDLEEQLGLCEENVLHKVVNYIMMNLKDKKRNLDKTLSGYLM